MSRSYTYRDIRYELKETQGFFFCLVFAEGEDTALFQTKYYASIEGATTAAINFIEDYTAYRNTKEEKERSRKLEPSPVEIQPADPTPPEAEKRATPSQLLYGNNIAQRAAARRPSTLLGRTTKSLETKTVPHKTKIWQENGEIRTSVPEVESEPEVESVPVVESEPDLRSSLLDYKKIEQGKKPVVQDRKLKIRPLPVILLSGTAVLSIFIIVGSASGFFENMLRRDPPAPVVSPTETPTIAFTPTQAEATIGLPAANPTDTESPTPETTVTLTPTSSITPTINPSTTPTRTPTRTPRPTNPPLTNTFTPVPTGTDTPTATITPSPEPPTATQTNTPTVPPPTQPWLPTATDSP